MIFSKSTSNHGFMIKIDEKQSVIDQKIKKKKTNSSSNLYGFGYNHHGQLGIGNNFNQLIPCLVKFFTSKRVKIVATGWTHSIFLVEHQIYSTGFNYQGQLGLGEQESQLGVNTPKLVQIKCKNEVVEVLECDCGYDHNIVLSTKLEVFSFGANSSYQLGLTNDVKGIAKKINFSEKIISICCGGNFSTFISIQGNLYVVGENKYGQLGIGSKIDQKIPQRVLFFKNKKILQVDCGGSHITYLTSDNQVYSSGRNVDGRIGITNDSSVTQKCRPHLISSLKKEKIILVKCGGAHTLFASKNKIWMTGYTGYGQIEGYDADIFSPVPVSIKGKKIIQFLMIYDSSIYFTEDGVYGSGRNDYGQLFCGKIKDKNNLIFKLCNLDNIKKHDNKSMEDIEKSIEVRDRFEFLMGKKSFVFF